jgi:hypothetical protein
MTCPIPSDYTAEVLVGIVPVSIAISPCCSLYPGYPLQIAATLTDTGQRITVAASAPWESADEADLAALVATLSVEVCGSPDCDRPRLVVTPVENGTRAPAVPLAWEGGMCADCASKSAADAFAPGGAFDRFAARHAHRCKLTSVHYSARLSEETDAFDAVLTWDGKKVGRVRNDGRGGPNEYGGDVAAIGADLRGDPEYAGDLDTVVGRVLTEWRLRRDAQRRFGAGKVCWLQSERLPSLGGSEHTVQWPEVLQDWQTGGRERFVAEGMRKEWFTEADLDQIVWYPDLYLDGIESTRRNGGAS